MALLTLYELLYLMKRSQLVFIHIIKLKNIYIIKRKKKCSSMFKYEQEMLRIEQDAFITQLNWQKN